MRMSFCIIWVVMLFFSQAFAQIYRYVDQEGNIRFTDNPTNIPSDCQAEIKTMAEIQAYPNQPLVGDEIRKNEMHVQAQDVTNVENDKVVNEKGEDEKLQITREPLIAERSEIQALYEQIEEDKKRLSNPLPESASRVERRANNQEILDLNQRIDDYQKKVDAYRIKVEAFNSGIQK